MIALFVRYKPLVKVCKIQTAGQGLKKMFVILSIGLQYMQTAESHLTDTRGNVKAGTNRHLKNR